LAESLVRDAHEAVVLSRSPERQRCRNESGRWEGQTLGAWVEEPWRADGVVKHAQQSIVGRWTKATKRRIRESRVEASWLVAAAFAAAWRRRLLLVQGRRWGSAAIPATKWWMRAPLREPTSLARGGGVAGGERLVGAAGCKAADPAHWHRAIRDVAAR